MLKSRKGHFKSEEEKENQQESIIIPIEWHVPDSIHNQYIQNVLVQPGKYEITLYFFETRMPLYMGTPEANREFLLNQGSVRFECVSKLTVAPQLVPQIIEALQTGLQNYNLAQANEKKGEDQ